MKKDLTRNFRSDIMISEKRKEVDLRKILDNLSVKAEYPRGRYQMRPVSCRTPT